MNKQRPYRGIPINGKDFVYGDLVHSSSGRTAIIPSIEINPKATWKKLVLQPVIEVIPESVGQFTGFCYENDYVVIDCWNGGDGINEENIHDIFEGIVIYDKKICRFGLQTKNCDKGQIEVGLEDSQFVSIEIIGNIHTRPELTEQKNKISNQKTKRNT